MTTTITPEFKNAQIADNVVMREHEVHQYQVNIDNYNHMLREQMNDLPEVAPPDADVYLKGRIDFRNRIRELVMTEMLEQMKANMVYVALKAQLPAEASEQLILEAAARRSAANS